MVNEPGKMPNLNTVICRVYVCEDQIFGISISQKMALVLTSPRITVS